MGRLILLLVLLLPLIEIATFIKVGGAIGVWPTLLGVLVAGVAGLLVIRAQGLSLVSDIRGTVRRGELPGRAIGNAMMVFIAGILLLIPGYFTDFCAILLLLPPVRSAIYEFLRSRMVVVATGAGSAYRPRVQDRGTIDLDEDNYRLR